MTLDHDILRAALVGYQMELHKLETAISAVKAKIGGSTRTAAAATDVVRSANGRRKRSMSPEARNRIAEAQKKRWAAYHKAQAGD
jgi:hypothetical protein